MPSPQRDSGVFLYTGWRILQGELPYLDAWDHKPPLIYYINALGLASGTIWGVWLLELAGLFAAGLVGYALVQRAFGRLAGVFSVGLFFIGLFPVLQGGNLTTEYALPLQMACLWLAREADDKDFRSRRGFFIGVLTGLMFFIRPNTIGVSIAIGIYLALLRLRAGQNRRWAGEMVTLIFGGLAVTALILGYFAVQGGLGELWDAAFRYNAVYSAVSLHQRLISLVIGLGGLAPSGLLPLAFLGYGVALAWQVYCPERVPLSGRVLMAILLIDLPIELLFTSLPGHAHPHYLITLLPALTWFSGFAFWIMASQLEWPAVPDRVQTLFTLGALGLLAWSAAGNSLLGWRTLRQGVDDTLAGYIAQVTAPQDRVLVWGAEAGAIFSARRQSATRYVYLSPLYTDGYTNEERVLEFLDAVLQARPALILDAPNDEMPVFEFPVRSVRIDERVAQLRQAYQAEDEVCGWRVYR